MAEPASMPPVACPSAFDAHNPPSINLINECVHCGFCLATCPTYALWGEEMDSPRGRIYLMKLGLEGQIQLDSTFVQHMDNCLGCMACMTACPSGVKYDKLIEATRAQIERNYPRPVPDGILRRMIFEIFPRPERLWGRHHHVDVPPKAWVAGFASMIVAIIIAQTYKAK